MRSGTERQKHRMQKLLCYNKHSPKQYTHQHTHRHHTNTRPFSVRISAPLEDLFPEVNCNERGCFYPIQRPTFLRKVLAFSRTNQTLAQEILKIWLENHYIYNIGLCLGQQVFLFLLEVSKFLWHLILLKIKYRQKSCGFPGFGGRQGEILQLMGKWVLVTARCIASSWDMCVSDHLHAINFM